MSVMCSLRRPERVFRHPFHCWVYSSRDGKPAHNSGWVLCPERFPEKTPEESDGFSRPHENRPKSEKLSRNKAGIITRFHQF